MKITVFIQGLKNNWSKLRVVKNISELKLKGRFYSGP